MDKAEDKKDPSRCQVRQLFKIQHQNKNTWTADALSNLQVTQKAPLFTAVSSTYFPLADCLAVILSSSFLPIWRSCLPSIEPVCTALSWSQNVICPFKAATASSLPSGRKATTRTAKKSINSSKCCQIFLKWNTLYFSRILTTRKTFRVTSMTTFSLDNMQMFS